MNHLETVTEDNLLTGVTRHHPFPAFVQQTPQASKKKQLLWARRGQMSQQQEMGHTYRAL